MIIGTDITNWMEDWVDIVVMILSNCFTILDGITFAGTSLLRVMLGIMLLSAFLPIIITLLRGSGEAIKVGSERTLDIKEKARYDKTLYKMSRSDKK